MNKWYRIIALIGALIWAGATLLRELPMPIDGPVRFALNVAPNFGVVFAVVGLSIVFWPYVWKRAFPAKGMYPFLCALLVLLLGSEIIHAAFLDAPFDIWDMAASALAAAVLAIFHLASQRKETPGNRTSAM